jgi:hypothetical protein
LSIDQEVESFADFIDSYHGHLAAFFDPYRLLQEYAEKALRSDIENISANRQDADTEHGWLNNIERVADRLGIAARLRADIAYERSSIDEYYAREKGDDPAPTSGGGYWQPASPSEQTRSDIGALFRQLL